MIFHIPHSRTYIPYDVRKRLLLNDEELLLEIRKMTDLYTDELFPVEMGIPVIFPVSRLVTDPERFPSDEAEPMSSMGMGAVYTRTSGGSLLRHLKHKERKDLLDRYYHPHHRILEYFVKDSLDKTGGCLILDCHSFSSIPLPHEPDRSVPRPDICLGTDEIHTPEELTDAMETFFSKEKLSFKRNVPFRGTLVPSMYFRKDTRVRSVMIEVNRSLYIDERTGRKSQRFDELKDIIRRLVATATV